MNALLVLLAVGQFLPSEYGAVYNSNKPDALAANRAAFDTMLGEISRRRDGGTIQVEGGALFVPGGIEVPKRMVGSTRRSISFSMVGTAPGTSRIVGHGQDRKPAIYGKHVYAGFRYPIPIVKFQDLVIQDQDSHGLEYIGGGKSIRIHGCQFSRCGGDGLRLAATGALVWDVYCVENNGTGLRMEPMPGHNLGGHQTRLHVTSRNNGGGAVLTNMASLDAWLYLESNSGYGLIGSNLSGGMFGWLENNRNSRLKQGILENCALDIRGQMVGVKNRGFMFDWSTLVNSTDNGEPMTSRPEPVATQDGLTVLNNLNGNPAKYSGQVVNGEAVEVHLPAGFANHKRRPATSSWARFDHPSLKSLLLKQGDIIEMAWRQTLTADSVSELRRLDAAKIPTYITLPFINPRPQIEARLFDLYQTSPTHKFRLRWEVQQDVTGLKPYMGFLAGAITQHQGEEPQRPIDMTITDWEVRVYRKP